MEPRKSIERTLSTTPRPRSAETVTQLLEQWSRGEREAAERLLPEVYGELRRIAHRIFRRERSGHTLQATALVHEIYLELSKDPDVQWESRSHFFGLAACMMRRALVDYSRERATQKRGGSAEKVPVEDAERQLAAPQRAAALIALDDALRDLERLDRTKALIVELRFFGGLTVEEVGEILDLSPRTVAREWRRARAALFRQLAPEERDAL